jgi:hypothetical protein
MIRFIALAAVCVLVFGASAQATVLADYTFGTGTVPTAVASLSGDLAVAGMTASDIAEGPTAFSTFRYAGNNGHGQYAHGLGDPCLTLDPQGIYTFAGAVAAGKYASFTLTATGGVLNLSSLSFDASMRSSGGNRYAFVGDSVDGYAGAALATADVHTVQYINNPESGVTTNPIWLNTVVPLSGAQYQGLSSITFRLYAADAWNGPVDFDNIIVNGEVTPEPATLALLVMGGIGMLIRRKR